MRAVEEFHQGLELMHVELGPRAEERVEVVRQLTRGPQGRQVEQAGLAVPEAAVQEEAGRVAGRAAELQIVLQDILDPADELDR